MPRYRRYEADTSSGYRTIHRVTRNESGDLYPLCGYPIKYMHQFRGPATNRGCRIRVREPFARDVCGGREAA